jgi:hypothetical protein
LSPTIDGPEVVLIALLLLRDLISETPGTSQFDFQGAYGTRLYFAKNVQTEQFGFHGQYRVTYSDGRPPTTGYASLFSAEKSGDWRVHFFRVEAGALHETQSRMITRVESRKPNPGIAGLNSPRSQAFRTSRRRPSRETTSSTCCPPATWMTWVFEKMPVCSN